MNKCEQLLNYNKLLIRMDNLSKMDIRFKVLALCLVILIFLLSGHIL